MYVPVLHDEEPIERANRVICSECLALAWNGRSWKARRGPWNALLKGDQELCRACEWTTDYRQRTLNLDYKSVIGIYSIASEYHRLSLGTPRFDNWDDRVNLWGVSNRGHFKEAMATLWPQLVEEEYQIWRRSSPRAGNMVLVGTEE